MTPRRLVSNLCAAGACLLLAVPMFAVGGAVQQDIARVTVDPSAITVEPATELDNGRIRLLNPEGLEIVRDLKGGFGQVTIDDLAREVEGLSLDGCWTYEIVGTPSLTATEQNLLEQSRETGRPVPLALQQKLQNSNQSGAFVVQEGRFFLDETTGETDIDGKLRAEVPNQFDSALGISAEVPTGLDRQVISGDLVVYNSICVGFDCPTNPSFGADTIRLQENNLRIHFDDTSTAASFPDRDWRIIANDQANGGAEKFTIQDASANRNVFTIEGSAPSNSLYVDDGGRVGMGTSTPVLEIHTVDGDTPALRLEQDGSSGFAPQTWDLAGNETSFFIRDATNGSTLPFRIRPGASSNSLVIDTDSDVGVGVLSPTDKLHVQDNTNPTNGQLFVENTSGSNSNRILLQMTNNGPVTAKYLDSSSGRNWNMNMLNAGFAMSLGGSGVNELLLQDDGDLIIQGMLTENSDRRTKHQITAVEPQDVLARVAALPISTWVRKSDVTQATHMGPMAQDFAELFGLGINNTSISSLDMAGVGLAAVQALNEKLETKQSEIEQLRSENESLSNRLQELESMVLQLFESQAQ